MNITITKKENPGKLPETDELGFGKYFSDFTHKKRAGIRSFLRSSY